MRLMAVSLEQPRTPLSLQDRFEPERLISACFGFPKPASRPAWQVAHRQEGPADRHQGRHDTCDIRTMDERLLGGRHEAPGGGAERPRAAARAAPTELRLAC